MPSDNGDDGEQGQDDAVIDNDVEEEEWTVAEEVEERPSNEDGEKDNHGDQVPKEAEIKVALDASGGFAECVRACEGGERLDELAPWMARGEDGAHGNSVGGGCGCGGKSVVVAW
nr:hypothetical protein CFP56_45902 [Quercus suber]